MDLLEGLNPPQQEAVAHTHGPLLIFAGAGSGKTRTLTHRIAYLIQHGASPHRILAVTFTNKAAKEMRERLENLVGPVAKRMWLGTFHAMCAQMLRIHGDRIGLNPRFSILDSDDQLRLMKEVVKEANLDTDRFKPSVALGKVSDAKNDLLTPEQVARAASKPHEKVYANLYARYQERLRATGSMDFDDLLMEAVRLLKESEETRNYWAQRFLHVLIDEFQDVNLAQFQWAQMLSSAHRNICVVGDDDQCLAVGTMVTTPDGDKRIEDVVAGDLVLGGVGRGQSGFFGVEKMKSRPYIGPMLCVQTRGGRTLRLTPNHMCFARLGRPEKAFYVYLMYHADKGFRVGLAMGARSDGRREELQNGLQVRCNQEGADKMWVLRVCNTKEDAVFWENFFAFSYGIPTTVFFAAGRGGLVLSQKSIDELFKRIDTRARAAKLMEEWNLDAAHPHYRPSGLTGKTTGLDRRVVHLTLFGGNEPTLRSPWFRHRVWLNTSGKVLEEQMERGGVAVRAGNRQTWRVEKVLSDAADAARLAEKIARVAGDYVGDKDEIARWASLTETGKFSFQPASHLRPTMIVPIEEQGRVVEDEILSIEEELYEGIVYDLDITNVRNFAANGVLVHNSIYAWRGADVKIILDFEKVYPDATIIRLEQNYRSTQNILDAAYGVISQNNGRAAKRLWTQEQGGAQLVLHGALNAQEEAAYVVRQIELLRREEHLEFKDFAILCRVNAQSRPFEEAFIRSRVPLKLVGTQRFYERREIRDVLAYLRWIYNPDDDGALKRLINVPPRGIGAATVDKLDGMAREQGRSVGAVLLDNGTTGKALTPVVARKVEPLQRLLRTLMDDAQKSLNLADLMEKILERTRMMDWLQGERDADSVDREANVQELVRACEAFDLRLAEDVNEEGETSEVWNEGDPLRLGMFLGEVVLDGGGDKDNQKNQTDDAVTFMTLHAAKGLEFPVVFLAGVEQGLLPHARAVFSENAKDEELEEERRLMYVGLTRAEKRAYITYAQQRTMHGRTETTQTSQFIDEIPDHLLQREGLAKHGSGGFMARSSDWGSAGRNGRNGTRERVESLPRPAFSSPSNGNGSAGANRDSSAKAPSFRVSDKVRHKTYGEGLVVAASTQGGAGEWVEVAFLSGDVGKKKLIVAFAGLEKAE